MFLEYLLFLFYQSKGTYQTNTMIRNFYSEGACFQAADTGRIIFTKKIAIKRLRLSICPELCPPEEGAVKTSPISF